MVATSAHRVQEQTAEHVNEQIRRQTEMNIAYYGRHPDRIQQRLRELDEEWDVERVLEVNSSALSLLGLVMGVARRRWLVLPLIVQGFFMQHALQGWCPPLEILRRFGYRTRGEIEQERYALKTLRGDFREVGGAGGQEADVDRLVTAIRS